MPAGPMRRERPIDLEAPDLRVLLEPPGRARLWLPIDLVGAHDGASLERLAADDWQVRDRAGRWVDATTSDLLAICPWGQVGDRLWVREEWAAMTAFNGCHARLVTPAANARERGRLVADRVDHPNDPPFGPRTLWRPPRTMPRWAARLVLELEAVAIDAAPPGDPGPPWTWRLSFRRVRA